MKDAEYFVGFARESLGGDFYRGAPKLRLIQLISAGYDRLDVGAARRAGVPVANNGGSQLVAGGPDNLMFMLAPSPKPAPPHPHHITPQWAGGGGFPDAGVKITRANAAAS